MLIPAPCSAFRPRTGACQEQARLQSSHPQYLRGDILCPTLRAVALDPYWGRGGGLCVRGVIKPVYKANVFYNTLVGLLQAGHSSKRTNHYHVMFYSGGVHRNGEVRTSTDCTTLTVLFAHEVVGGKPKPAGTMSCAASSWT